MIARSLPVRASTVHLDPFVSEPRHLITGTELTRAESRELIERARGAEAARNGGPRPLAGPSVGMIFEKPSTRTRVSFEVGIAQLGGTPVVLRGEELQASRGESPRDTALVLSRYLDAIVAPASATTR